MARILEDASGVSYLVDANGEAYEPYSLAWRYLGMFIDCDIDPVDVDDDGINRKLASHDDGNSCGRKVLWAAYHDPGYLGGSIGEYQFFVDGEWDKSTCQTKRCARMDCHERFSHFKLVGVFKETDGLYDWAEQLFKHEGYCIWGGDKEESGDSGDKDNGGSDYEFMQTRLENWPQECTQLYLADDYGNTVYLNTKPLPGGNMTYGLYTDEDCVYPSDWTFRQYVIKYYTTYYYNSEKGYEQAEYWDSSFQRWNELMSVYKQCQPCRAYNRVPTSNEGNSGDRLLEQTDGSGDEEQWGYSCFDDAGYTNCDQCYKFEAKTDMEPASTEDLKRATIQGTILEIRVDGKVYGSGSFHSDREQTVQRIILLVVIGVLVGIMFVGRNPLYKRIWEWWKASRREIKVQKLAEALTDFTSNNSREKELEEARREAEEKYAREAEKHEEDVDKLKFQLDMERMKFHLERTRTQERVQKLRERIASLNPNDEFAIMEDDEKDIHLNLSFQDQTYREMT